MARPGLCENVERCNAYGVERKFELGDVVRDFVDEVGSVGGTAGIDVEAYALLSQCLSFFRYLRDELEELRVISELLSLKSATEILQVGTGTDEEDGRMEVEVKVRVLAGRVR